MQCEDQEKFAMNLRYLISKGGKKNSYLLDCRGYNSLGSGGSGKQAKGPISIPSG